MWIETSNEDLQSLYNAELMDAAVEFNDSGSAQVDAELGQRLIDNYDSITEKDNS